MAKQSFKLVAFILLALLSSCVSGRSPSTQKLEIRKHLKRLNKPAVKSIKSADGDIIDCVHIYHQPAFDHPYLKSHKIKTKPSSHPDGLLHQSKLVSKVGSNVTTQIWQLKGSCAEGTIPIRRTTKADLSRASSVKRYGRKKHRGYPRPTSVEPGLASQRGHQHAIAYVNDDSYCGAKATINVWQPKIQLSNEFSLSQIWVLGGSFEEDLNSIEAGWQVSHDLYGDNSTRLFTYWTSDAYHATGCYNLLCSGFIQTSSEIAMGAAISPLSTYQGDQYDVTLLIFKDNKQDVWWLQFGNDKTLGYWPGYLFSYLTESASMIEWGGEVVNTELDGFNTLTQMGSGRFPAEGFGKASYFKNVQIVTCENTLHAPSGLNTYTEHANCYDVQTDYNNDWGSYFYYGGPGDKPNCQ